MKNSHRYLVESLKSTRNDSLGLFLEKLIEKGYRISDSNGDYLVIENYLRKGVVAFDELREFKGKGVSGKRLFFNLSDEWDKYQQSPIALPAPANECQVDFALNAIDSLKVPEGAEDYIWDYC
ncbi:MAG: hypothetical protein RLZZ29_1299 [Cyanobacteriota bacterium]|jgi:hypothetical protein